VCVFQHDWLWQVWAELVWWRERAGEIESLLERVLERGGEGAGSGGNSLGMLGDQFGYAG
jgi:hypothetical protein